MLTVLAWPVELEVVRLLSVDEVVAAAEGVVVLALDDEDVEEATRAFDVVHVAFEVVLVFPDELDDEG